MFILNLIWKIIDIEIREDNKIDYLESSNIEIYSN